MNAVGEPKPWRLWVDGEERTNDCDAIDFGMPGLIYDASHDTGPMRRVLGPLGFWIKLTEPSERLRELADGGKRIRQLKLLFGDQALPVPVQFHEEWVEDSGVRRMFGCLAYDRSSGPLWVTEPANDEGQRPLTLATKEG